MMFALGTLSSNKSEWEFNELILLHRARWRGDFESVKFAIDSGIKFNDHGLSIDLFTQNGQLESVKYAIEYGKCTSLRDDLCATASELGHLDLLQYLLSLEHTGTRYKGETDTCAYAAANGHLGCLKYARIMGCEWDANTPALAARNGRLHCLKFALEKGCETTADVVLNAIEFDHFDCFKLALEMGCEITAEACYLSAKFNRIECLKILREEFDCDWDHRVLDIAKFKGFEEIVAYAEEYDACGTATTIAHVKKIMMILDDVKENIPNNSYLEMCTELKSLYEENKTDDVKISKCSFDPWAHYGPGGPRINECLFSTSFHIRTRPRPTNAERFRGNMFGPSGCPKDSPFE